MNSSTSKRFCSALAARSSSSSRSRRWPPSSAERGCRALLPRCLRLSHRHRLCAYHLYRMRGCRVCCRPLQQSYFLSQRHHCHLSRSGARSHSRRFTLGVRSSELRCLYLYARAARAEPARPAIAAAACPAPVPVSVPPAAFCSARTASVTRTRIVRSGVRSHSDSSPVPCYCRRSIRGFFVRGRAFVSRGSAGLSVQASHAAARHALPRQQP
eukprot:6214025-Pleurochrysis_carterae.AAC.9